MVPWYKQYYHRLWECLPYLSCIAFIGLKYCFCPLQKILLEDVRIIYVEYLYLDADWALNLKEMLESNEVFWTWTRSPQSPRPSLWIQETWAHRHLTGNENNQGHLELAASKRNLQVVVSCFSYRRWGERWAASFAPAVERRKYCPMSTVWKIAHVWLVMQSHNDERDQIYELRTS